MEDERLRLVEGDALLVQQGKRPALASAGDALRDRAGIDALGLGALESEFVAVAAGYAVRKKISYEAWREAGVSAATLKAAGITLYTITFGDSPSATGQSLMRGCATSPAHYWHSPDGTNLRTVFRTIGTQLSKLRIAQ